MILTTRHLILLGALGAAPALAKSCPTDLMRPLDTTFSGALTVLDAGGQVTQAESVADTHDIVDCHGFSAHLVYRSANGAVTREQRFSGTWDESRGMFAISGANIDGTVQPLGVGKYYVRFQTRFADTPVACDELITVSASGAEMQRTVHCAAVESGVSVGVRVVQAARQ
jgi:hypothetical protein